MQLIPFITESSSNNSSFYFHICLLVFNIILYGCCCLMILKRKSYTCVSMRSPTILLFNIIFNFFCNNIIILTYILKEHQNATTIVSGFYYLFQVSMMLSFFFRCQRIVACYQLQKNEKLDIKQFYSKYCKSLK